MWSVLHVTDYSQQNCRVVNEERKEKNTSMIFLSVKALEWIMEAVIYLAVPHLPNKFMCASYPCSHFRCTCTSNSRALPSTQESNKT